MGFGQLYFESDGAHQLERVALLNDSRSQTVVEHHLSIFQVVFEVTVGGARCERDGFSIVHI